MNRMQEAVAIKHSWLTQGLLQLVSVPAGLTGGWRGLGFFCTDSQSWDYVPSFGCGNNPTSLYWEGLSNRAAWTLYEEPYNPTDHEVWDPLKFVCWPLGHLFLLQHQDLFHGMAWASPALPWFSNTLASVNLSAVSGCCRSSSVRCTLQSPCTYAICNCVQRQFCCGRQSFVTL